MSAQELITEHLDLWTEAVTKKSSSGRGINGKLELTGVKKLRELILEFAVRGMLVDQAPNEAPASMLLDEILKERKRLTNEGQIRGQKCPPATELDRLPAKLPNGWAGATLSHLGIFSGGKTPSKSRSEFWNGDIPWVTPKDMKSAEIATSEDHVTQDALKAGGLALLPENAVLFVVRSGILRRMFPTAVTRIQCTINQDLKALQLFKPEMARYIQVLSWGFERFILEKLTKTGTTVESLKFSDFANQPFPFPPLEEQYRIVQKVDELMALCDRLEQQTSDQLEAHDTLVGTLLGTLTQSENATDLADNWVRLGDHFDSLFTTEQSIDKLKQTILQLAVMGRLVEQDAEDEPASELLDSITAERHKLVQSGRMRTPKIPANTNLQISPPFPVPHNWSWGRLGELFAIVTDGDHQAPPKSEEGVPFLVIGNLNTGRIDFAGCKHVNETYYSQLDWSRKPTNGDLLYTVTGSYGIPIKVLTSKAFCVQRHVAILRATASTPRDYVKLVLESEYGQSYADEIATGIAQKTVPLTGLRKMPIPLPPQAEQYRIVQKVDELMALCDQLKERLNQASETRCQLAEAVVEQAIS